MPSVSLRVPTRVVLLRCICRKSILSCFGAAYTHCPIPCPCSGTLRRFGIAMDRKRWPTGRCWTVKRKNRDINWIIVKCNFNYDVWHDIINYIQMCFHSPSRTTASSTCEVAFCSKWSPSPTKHPSLTRRHSRWCHLWHGRWHAAGQMICVYWVACAGQVKLSITLWLICLE